MKTFLFSLLVVCNLSSQAQLLLQPGRIVAGNPLRRLSDEPVGVPSVGFGTEFLSIDNYNLTGTSICMSSIHDDWTSGFVDTVYVGDYIDSTTTPLPKSHFYQYGLTFGNMFIAGGITHRTVPLFRPIVVCAAGFFDPNSGWVSDTVMRFGWTFSPANIEYDRFDTKYVCYASSKIVGGVGGLAFFPRITGVFNRFVANDLALELYDIYPEERFPSHKIFEIPIESPFYMNHVVEVDRKLLISGFEVDASSSFIKKPKAILVDLEEQTRFEYELSFNENNLEVISGLLGENGVVYFIVRETGVFGEFVESRIIRYDNQEIRITSFYADFIPNSIIKQTNHGLLLGGDYDRFGLKTAAVFEVEQYIGLKRMVGYANLGSVESRFKYFDETIIGEVIVGSYDSLNGTPRGSFMTPLVHESLLSIENEEQTEELFRLGQNQLYFLESNNYSYQIIDALGRNLLSGKTSEPRLSLSELNGGFYAITVWTGDKSQTIKTVLINH